MSLSSIYSKGVLTRTCALSLDEVGRNIKELLETKLRRELEGKCSKDGYIKDDSLQVITYSSGKIMDGSTIMFEVVIEVLVAFPVEGMLIEATADNITKAGIKASIPDTDPSPIIIFISRDHFHSDDYFRSIEEGKSIVVRVIGQRFELNDPFISVIGELVKPRDGQGAPVAAGQKGQAPYVVLE
jgi:DNA-directed RNA polymerase subunit E'/Rpb7